MEGKRFFKELLVVSFLLLRQVTAEIEPPAVEWQSHFGFQAGVSPLVYAVETTAEGGAIVCGTADFMEKESDLYVAKTDSDGNLLWEKTFGGEGADTGRWVARSSDGGAVVIGSTCCRSGSWDIYLVKIDGDGNLLWEQTIGGEATETGRSVQETEDGGYVVCGSRASGLGGSDAISHVYLAKSDPEGNLIWEKTFSGTSFYDVADAVRQTEDGGFIVTGTVQSVRGGDSDIYLLRTDAEGSLLWERRIGGEKREDAFSVEETADGGYVLVGETTSLGAGELDIYLVKTDSEGAVLWDKTFGTKSSDYGRSVRETVDGDYVVAGWTHTYKGGYYDIYLFKTDSDGELIWDKTFGGYEKDFSSSVVETTSGGYLVAGRTYQAGAYEVFLLNTDRDGNTIWESTFGLVEGTAPSANTVAATSDGGYIVAGNARFFQYADVYLAKTDAEGRPIWERKFGYEYEEEGYDVLETRDGSYIVAGRTRSFSGEGDYDVYLLKSDSDGEPLWETYLGGTMADEAYAIEETADGGYAVIGSTQSFGGGDFDVYLIRTDIDGRLIWQRTLGGPMRDEGRSLQRTHDGGYIITGWTRSFGGSEEKLYLVKTDVDGNPVWENTFGENHGSHGQSVQETRDGGFVITGSERVLREGTSLTEARVLVVKTDAEGNLLWSKTFARGAGQSVYETKEGLYLVTGTTQDFGRTTDAYLLKTDGEGNRLWETAFGGERLDFGHAVRETREGGTLLAGGTHSFGNGPVEVYLVQLAQELAADFKRGDSDGDGVTTLNDAIFNLSYQFLGTAAPRCLKALDFTNDGKIQLDDPIGNLSHQFLGGVPPAPPGEEVCGADVGKDPLSCVAYENCESS